jgi:hypothetical protein
MLGLELCRCPIAQAGVQPGVVVEPDVTLELAHTFLHGPEVLVVHHLRLQAVEEGFHVRVVIAIAFATQAPLHTNLSQDVPYFMGHILNATV